MPIQPCSLSALILLAYLTAPPPDTEAESQKAITALEKIAIKVVRDEKLAAKPIVELHLRDIATDKTLANLKHLPDLRVLNLTFTGITDEGLKQLKDLNNLEELGLGLTRITDKGLEHIKSLPRLQTLSLFCTHVSSDGLKQLQELKSLRRLALDRHTDYSEAVAELTKALPELTVDQGNGNSAEKRARKHFAIDETQRVDQKTIQSTILANVPIGSSKAKIRAYLKTCGIGKDQFSGVYDDDGRILCRIEFDPRSGWLVHQHFGIFFQMDAESGLKEIEVEEWFTGP